MQFSAIRTELNELHMDTSSEWTVNGTLAKKCVNKAYEYLYDILKNSSKIKREIATGKIAITITNKTATLPVDFDVMDIVSFSDFASDSNIDDIYTQYYGYRVTGPIGARVLQVEDLGISTLYIRYVPVRIDMSSDGDIPKLPESLHRCIADFAIVEYYRRIRDNIEAANSLSLAQSYMDEKLSRL